eukprot:Gb_29981 [translate_table: standard]
MRFALSENAPAFFLFKISMPFTPSCFITASESTLIKVESKEEKGSLDALIRPMEVKRPLSVKKDTQKKLSLETSMLILSMAANYDAPVNLLVSELQVRPSTIMKHKRKAKVDVIIHHSLVFSSSASSILSATPRSHIFLLYHCPELGEVLLLLLSNFSKEVLEGESAIYCFG